jgi:hypothetical protein
MKKSQLLAAMSLLTIFGIGLISAGLFSAVQESSFTLSQAWNNLWATHTVFAWVMTFYCVGMLALDLFVIAGILMRAPETKEAY